MAQELSEKIIIEKYQKGETLTPEEEKFVMSEEHTDDFEQDLDVENEDNVDDKEDFKKEQEEVIEEEAEEGEKEEEEEKKNDKDEDKKDVEDEKIEEEPEEAKEEDLTKEEQKKIDEKRVEDELAKPDGSEDLTGFTREQKGLFYAMKKERHNRQRLEEENDKLKFKLFKRQDEDKKKEDEDDPDALVTKQELKKIRQEAIDNANAQARNVFLGMWAREGRKECGENFDKVLNLGERLIDGNDFYKAEILKATQNGGNPAIKAYELITTDPNFDKLYADTYPSEQKREEVKEEVVDTKSKNKKLKENLKKPVTTGAKGGGGNDAPKGELTAEDYAKMSDKDFMKLPPKERKKIEQYLM